MMHKADYRLELIDTGRDAVFIQKLSIPDVRAQLHCMGDPENVSLDVSKIATKTQDDQIWWAMRQNDHTIGLAWIDTDKRADITEPSLHFAIESDEKTALAAVKEMIRYAYCNLPYPALYSRHLVGSVSSGLLDKKIGFENDGDVYEDESGNKWQNIVLVL